MRISYFNYHWEVDGTAIGAATQIRSIASALSGLGHVVDLQFRNPRKQTSGESHDGVPGGLKRFSTLRRYGHVPKLVLRNFRYIPQEIRMIQSFRPDVLLSVTSYCNLSALYAARKMGIPYVAFVDGPLEYEYSLFYPEYYRYPALGQWLEGMNLRCADRVICISEVLKGYLVRYGVDASKIHAIPNGIDAQAFKPGEPDREIQNRYGLQGKVVVGYIGSFNFFSSPSDFIDLARTICSRNPEVVFLLAGAGPICNRMKNAATKNGMADRMLFTGMVPHLEVPRIMSVMDIVVSPYRDDYLFYNSSMKLLEYMAAGKAPVATALGQIKELVHDGYNGMLYEPGDYTTMASRIEKLVKDPELRLNIAANARKTVETDWTWERQAGRIAGVLEKAIRQ